MTDLYARQQILTVVGREGLARLGAATVLVVGGGGLGCAVLPYLAAAALWRGDPRPLPTLTDSGA